MAPDPSTTGAQGLTTRTDRPEPTARRDTPEDAAAEGRLFTHLITVLSVSSAMVGVCLTAIGLIGVMRSVGRVETVVDDLLAVGALLFMITTVLSFLGLRTGLTKNWRYFARTLDSLFCVGLVLVVIATMLLTWMVV
jgi:hypothetical protein